MNVIGVRTLIEKEVRRFMVVPGQTLFSPVISTSLYFLIFGFTLGGREGDVEHVPYLVFIVPGLVFLGTSNNAFLNASSSIFINKIQGTMVDLLVAPLGPMELMIGFVAGAMARGLLVGGATWGVSALFCGFQLARPLETLFFLALSAYVFAMLGLLAGLWADKFEQINFFPTFVMLPLTFLGGVFYSVRRLPEPLRTLSLFNPVVPIVEGLRAGMLGLELPAAAGMMILVGSAVGSTGLAYHLLKTGYKLKA